MSGDGIGRIAYGSQFFWGCPMSGDGIGRIACVSQFFWGCPMSGDGIGRIACMSQFWFGHAQCLGALSRTQRNFRPMGLFLGLGLELKMGRLCHEDDPAPSSAHPMPTTKQPPPRSNSTQSPPSLITVFVK